MHFLLITALRIDQNLCIARVLSSFILNQLADCSDHILRTLADIKHIGGKHISRSAANQIIAVYANIGNADFLVNRAKFF